VTPEVVDLGSIIDSVVLRPENLARLFGEEKFNVTLPASDRDTTVNLLGPLVGQVLLTGTPLRSERIR
jgi:hypothetical protein